MSKLGSVRTPPEWLIGSESSASPSQLRPLDAKEVRWYLPTWGERLKLMGWWNVLWLPPIALAAFIIIALPRGRYLGWMYIPFWLGWSKPLIVLFLVPFSLAIKRAGSALKNRSDPFCIHCGYSLVGLEEGHACPECGESISYALCREYQRDPHFFIERYRLRNAMPKADVAFEAGEHRVESTDGT